jgi:hypothetical protein
MMEDFSPFIHKEAFNILCTNQLGKGISRTVYSSEILDDCVIKIEDSAGFFQNIAEWTVWDIVKDTKHAKWFAPCVAISPCGSILVQKKTIASLKYPKKLPGFLDDTSTENYGTYDGRFVCHDYGWGLIIKEGLNSKLKTVEWRR